MAQLQHRLAVVEIVPGEELIEPHQILLQIFDLRIVKLLEERHD
jgi:hypothetical protein